MLIVPRDHTGGVEFDPDASVHERDHGERNEINVREQDGGVDFPHLWAGPVLEAGERGYVWL